MCDMYSRFHVLGGVWIYTFCHIHIGLLPLIEICPIYAILFIIILLMKRTIYMMLNKKKPKLHLSLFNHQESWPSLFTTLWWSKTTALKCSLEVKVILSYTCLKTFITLLFL